jgi:uncharacterized protein
VLKIFIKLIDLYQKYLSFDTGLLRFITPGGACKYKVRCSEYVKQMIIKYGIMKGSILGARRIISCR